MTLAFPLPRGRVFALGLVFLTVLMGVPLTASAAELGAGSVTLTILDVSPSTPTPSETLQHVTVTFRVRNNTAQALNSIAISAERETPITDQKALDTAMAHPSKPDASFVSPVDTGSTTVDVAAGSTTDGIFDTTIGIPQTGGICECANAIYPLLFSAITEDKIVLGTAQTYVPAFMVTNPAKVQVGWVWPLLDVPHRLTSDTTFLNDDLTGEVSPGGRLDRALAVLEKEAPTVPMTVITDPELIDELEVMAEGGYQVQSAPGARVTAGIGTGAAAAWLSRLRTVLTDNPSTELDLTPYGDPNVEALQRSNLSWTNGQPAAMQTRVTAALGGVEQLSDIAWPRDETLSKDTLESLGGAGTKTVILNSATLPGALTSPSQNALATYPLTRASAIAGIVNPSIERWVDKVFASTGPSSSYLPELVAQVALHAVTSVDNPHFVLITPPRYLDVDPAVAERAISDTAATVWSEPLPLRKAAQTLPAKSTTALKVQQTTPLPASTLYTLDYVAQSASGLTNMFAKEDQRSETGGLQSASQLAASSSWQRPADAVEYSDALNAVVLGLRNGVHLVKPARGNYTLTSTNSSLPITITNDLNKPVLVNVTAAATGGVPGFSATPIVSRLVKANDTIQIKLPTHFVRPGRIEVQVQLSTPTGLSLGDNIVLSVRSTALGAVGVIITTVAGVVLFVALLVRVVNRVRRRDRKNAAAT